MTTLFFIGADRWSGLAKLFEESGELVQVCGKLVGNGGENRHWDGSLLWDRLGDEMGDVLAAIDFVIAHAPAKQLYERVQARREEKLKTFGRWHIETSRR